MAGADDYPDIVVGRFSAESAADVDTQVQRTIAYETLPATGEAWFDRGAGIASNQGPGDDGEYDNQHLDNAINIPLYFMRLKINTLDPDREYVVCCDTGRRSSAGAYILSERGFKAYVLRDGINKGG